MGSMHLSELQDKYHKRLTEKGYDLERGIKGSDNKHIKIKEYKQITKKVNHELNVRNNKLDKAINDFEEKMKITKQTLIIDKDFVKVKKDTFESMNNVIYGPNLSTGNFDDILEDEKKKMLIRKI